MAKNPWKNAAQAMVDMTIRREKRIAALEKENQRLRENHKECVEECARLGDEIRALLKGESNENSN